MELGVEAHLLRLQMDELLEDVDDDRELVLLDYLPDDRDERLDSALAELAALSTDELMDLRMVAATLLPNVDGIDVDTVELDMSLQPRGYRLLDKVPRLAEEVVDQLVQRHGTLQKLMRATTEDLAVRRRRRRRRRPHSQGRPGPPGRDRPCSTGSISSRRVALSVCRRSQAQVAPVADESAHVATKPP